MIASIDREANLIESKESGALAPVSNHTIRFQPLENGGLHYTDEIEIRAGVLNGIIWAFAHLFYRHRQRHWKSSWAAKYKVQHETSRNLEVALSHGRSCRTADRPALSPQNWRGSIALRRYGFNSTNLELTSFPSLAGSKL